MFQKVSFYFNKRRYGRNWSDSCHITVFSGNTCCTLVHKRYSEMTAYAVEGIVIISTANLVILCSHLVCFKLWKLS